MQSDWDLIVVGGGVLGTFHAYWGSQRGWKTLLIERNDWPRDASVRNFGTLVPSAMSPGEWHRRGLESVAIYRELAAKCPIKFWTNGTLYPATTPVEQSLLHELADLGPKNGYRCTLLDPEAALRSVPILNRSNIRCALQFPDDGRVEPRSLFPTLISWMQAHLGTTYSPCTVVAAIEPAGDWANVRVADGRRWRARQVIVCSGADLRSLFPERLAQAGLQTCKLQMCRVVPAHSRRWATTLASGLTQRRYDAFRMCPSWPMLSSEAPAPGVLENGIHILMVQDDDGSLILGDSHDYAAGDRCLDERYNTRIEDLIVKEAKRLVDLADFSITERWLGVYSLLPSAGLFMKQPAPNIHLITGIGGKGMTTAPALARETIAALPSI